MNEQEEEEVFKIVRESLSSFLDGITPEYDRKFKIIGDLNKLGCKIENFGPFLIKDRNSIKQKIK